MNTNCNYASLASPATPATSIGSRKSQHMMHKYERHTDNGAHSTCRLGGCFIVNQKGQKEKKKKKPIKRPTSWGVTTTA